VDVAAHQRVDDLAHRQHDAAQQHEALAQLEAAPGTGSGVRSTRPRPLG
jgi:hypothetical protein